MRKRKLLSPINYKWMTEKNKSPQRKKNRMKFRKSWTSILLTSMIFKIKLLISWTP